MRVELDIQPAKKWHVLNHKNDLRHGLVYFVKSVVSDNIFCGACTTGDHTNKKEFSAWFSQGRIYVMVSALDNNVIITDN